MYILFSMKKLIILKFYKDILVFFLVSLLLAGIIVWTIQAVNYFDFVTEDGHGLNIYFYYSILNFPKIIQRILPFIFFISIFYIIINLEFKNEIYIYWIYGISKIKLLNLTLFFSLIFMFFQLVLSIYYSPLSQLKARSYLKNSDINFFTSLIKEGVFINITKGLTIFIDKKKNDGTLKNIFLEETNKSNSKMIYATNGVLIDNKFQKILKLTNGQVINVENSRINVFNFDQINFNLKNLNTKTITTPKLQEINTKILLSCYFNIENDKFKSFKCDENFIKEVNVELIKRLYKPIYIPLITLFCCYLLLLSKNQKNYRIKTNAVFIFVFFLLIFSEASIRYVVNSTNFMYIYLLVPFLTYIIGYFAFIRLAKNV
jgi:lipopolysaccharide export system permease protein